MGLFDGIKNFAKDHWDDVLVGAASVAGFALGGPAGAALLGGVVGGATAAIQGEDILMGAGLGAAGGLLGGLGGFGVRGAMFAKGAALEAAERGLKLGADKAAKLAANQSGRFSSVIPTALGGAARTPMRTYLGLVSAATMPYGLKSSVEQALAEKKQAVPPTFDDVPVIDISDKDPVPTGMPHVYMPDPNRLPNGLVLSPGVESRYRSQLPAMYIGCWKSFGEKGKTDPPKAPDTSDIKGAGMSNLPSYIEKVHALRAETALLKEPEGAIAALVSEAAKASNDGQTAIGAGIEALTAMAKINPSDSETLALMIEAEELPLTTLKFGPDGSVTEDAYVVSLIDFAATDSEATMELAIEQLEELAQKIEAVKPEPPEDKDDKVDPFARNPYTGNPYTGNPYQYQYQQQPQNPGDLTAPPPWEWNSGDQLGTGQVPSTTTTASTPNRFDRDGLDRVAANPGEGGSGVGVNTGTGGLGTNPTTAGLSQTGLSAPVASPSSAGPDIGSMILPGLLSQMMNGANAAGQGPGSGDEHRGRRERDDRPGRTGSQTPGTKPVAASGQSGAPTQGRPSQASPAGRVATPVSAPAAMPPRGPAPQEGNVVYTFPDGRTQEVSAVVAQALDGAIGNKAGTDARGSYAKTSISWTDDRSIGRRVDPNQLMTGDVAVWSDCAALVVAFPGEPEPTLEVIVDGELRPFTGDMTGKQGGFGSFVAFQHPPGIEKSAPGDGAVTDTEHHAAVAAVAG
ncbi:hypothetical protein [Nocardia cyriacigeorgica]|uniref:hypothetical protein n=1 Tax=Nocardia cyriacigeorgica TaxID=135487 RepID=UPI002456496F|nr:hypothetical protein [Nocardia cyriacigeorgica]